MSVLRVLVNWTGYQGGPGYTALYFSAGGGLISDAQQCADRVASAFGFLRDEIPGDISLSVDPEVREYDEASGELLDFHEVDPENIGGTAQQGSYAAAAGAVVSWRTNNVRNGRRIRGRTFIVPLLSSNFESDGTLDSGVIQSLNAFASELTSWDLDSRFGIWSRPVNGAGGQMADAIGYSIPDMSAVLRSRRD